MEECRPPSVYRVLAVAGHVDDLFLVAPLAVVQVGVDLQGEKQHLCHIAVGWAGSNLAELQTRLTPQRVSRP